jgi:hypothetical protein
VRFDPTRRRLVASAALLSAALGGCPALLSDSFQIDDDSGAGGGGFDATASDAASDASLGMEAESAAEPEGGPVDASGAADGADAPAADAMCCGTTTDPLDESTFDRWVPLGTVRAYPAFIELCPDKSNQAGGIFWPTEDPMTNFEIRFDFSITKTPDGGKPGDGLVLAAMTDISAPCEAGSNLCLIGTAPGFGVLVRTFAMSTEPAAPYLALIDTSRLLSREAGPPLLGGLAAHIDGGIAVTVASTTSDPPDGSWRTLCLRVVSDTAAVVLDGKTLLADVAVPPLENAHWGFMAATGASSERTSVRQVAVRGSAICGDGGFCDDASLCGP